MLPDPYFLTPFFSPVVYGYGYDGARELLSAVKTSSTGGAALDTYAYRYDPAGNRLGQQMALSGTNFVTSSVYNKLNQVASVSGTSGLELAISGSLSEPGTVAIGSTVVSTDSNYDFTLVVPVVTGSNSEAITATSSGTAAAQTTGTLGFNVAGGTAMSPLAYDANGNLTTNGTTNYVYDAANRLVQIWYGPVGSSSNTAITYDGLGRKVQILETSSSGTVTSTKNLIWDGLNIREELSASNAVTKMYFNNGVWISGTNYYYTSDHLGSIREVTGTTGLVQARYDYDPYGNQTQLSGTINVDFGYTGLYYHEPSELNFAPYREYSPALGRWISRDPIGMHGGVNLYAYVFNDPIKLTDPEGLCKKDCDAQLRDCQAAANEQFIVNSTQARNNRDRLLSQLSSAETIQISQCEKQFGIGTLGSSACDAAAEAATSTGDNLVWTAYNLRAAQLRIKLNLAMSACDFQYLQCEQDNANQ
jgi:RHS repeat-associated protein